MYQRLLTAENGHVSFENRPESNIDEIPGDIRTGQVTLEEVVKTHNGDDRDTVHWSDTLAIMKTRSR